MHPLLFKLGPIPFHTYGFFVAIGFLSAVFVIRKLSEKSKLDVDQVMDLAFWGTLVGFAGARALFVFTRFEMFMAEPLSIFKVWEGGLVFFGGPLVVVPFGIWFIKKHKLDLWKTLDVAVPGLTIGHMFGRFGCLSAGCCYGKPTELPWGIKLYSELVERHLRGVPLHPTQIYEAMALLLLFIGLIYVFKKKAFDGQVFLTYFMAYPIIRSIVEVFRGDLIRGFIIEDWVSTSQFISFLVFIAAAATLKYRLGQIRK